MKVEKVKRLEVLPEEIKSVNLRLRFKVGDNFHVRENLQNWDIIKAFVPAVILSPNLAG